MYVPESELEVMVEERCEHARVEIDGLNAALRVLCEHFNQIPREHDEGQDLAIEHNEDDEEEWVIASMWDCP